MARKHSNARQKPYRRKTRVKPNIQIVQVSKRQDDGMSPGYLVAIAEWISFKDEQREIRELKSAFHYDMEVE